MADNESKKNKTKSVRSDEWTERDLAKLTRPGYPKYEKNPKADEPSKGHLAASITVEWGNNVEVSLTLSQQNWAKIKSGKPFSIRGKGYFYEGKRYQDYWSFGGGLEGSLIVVYGEDSGVGFDGRLSEAKIEEIPAQKPKK